MELLIHKLRVLADAPTLDAYNKECRGLQQLLDKGCRPAPEPTMEQRERLVHANVPLRAPPGVGGVGDYAPDGPVVPALAAALAHWLRLLFPRDGAPGWLLQVAPPAAEDAVRALWDAFMRASGFHYDDAHSGAPSTGWARGFERLLEQTGERPCPRPGRNSSQRA